MTTMRDREFSPPTDAAIKAMFDRRANRADGAWLRAQILSATVAAPQTRGWRRRLPFDVPQTLPRVLVLALLAAALVGIGLLGVGVLHPQPAPTGFATEFIRPFEYRTPADGTFKLVGTTRPEIVSWAVFPDHGPSPDPSAVVTDRQPEPSNVRGIVVASASAAWAHGPDGRFMVQRDPAGFIADLRDLGGLRMGPVSPTTLDGHAALTVTLLGTGGTDVHVTGAMTGLSQDYVLMNLPARLIVADVDRATIFVLAWARTTEDLEAWLPVADEFVSSIHFRRGDQS